MGVSFNMIGIFVQNLQEMVRFYRDVLEIEIEWDGIGPYAEFNHDGIRLAMYERVELKNLLGKEVSFSEGINGTFELALNVGNPENVDKKFNEFINKGAKEVYKPRNEPWNMRSAMILDPENNLIEIASDFWK